MPCAALGDRAAQGLLAVQVLAGIEGPRGDDPVPVVGHRDEDRVDVLPHRTARSASIVAGLRIRGRFRLTSLLKLILLELPDVVEHFLELADVRASDPALAIELG